MAQKLKRLVIWLNVVTMNSCSKCPPLPGRMRKDVHVTRQLHCQWWPHHWQLLWQHSVIWRDVSVSVKCDTTLDCIFCKLPQSWTSNFHKLAWQHTESMVGSIIRVLLEINFSVQQWKNFRNLLKIDKVIAMSLVYYFFWGHNVVWVDWTGRHC